MIRTVRRSLIAAATAALIAASAIVGAPATRAEVDVYSTPGTHHVNGRDWRTTCEKYSQTTRCRTEIKATAVAVDGGRYVQRTDWAFNNLTYEPSDWGIWKGNPLASPGSWTAADGRQWTTECNTSATGGNGCRSYAMVTVLFRDADTGLFGAENRWVFNNIARFTPGTMPDFSAPATIPDAKLLACLTEALHGAPPSPATLAHLTFLQCEADDLTGLEQAVNLRNVHLSGRYTDLAPVAKLPKLSDLTLHDNAALKDLRPLAASPGLSLLTLHDTGVTDFSPLAAVAPLTHLRIHSPSLTSLGTAVGGPALEYFVADDSPRLADVSALGGATGLTNISLRATAVTALPSMAKLRKLVQVDVSDTRLAALTAFTGHPSLWDVNFSATPVTDVSPLVSVPKLRIVSALETNVTNWTVLKPKFDAGGLQIFWFAPSDGYTPPW